MRAAQSAPPPVKPSLVKPARPTMSRPAAAVTRPTATTSSSVTARRGSVPTPSYPAVRRRPSQTSSTASGSVAAASRRPLTLAEKRQQQQQAVNLRSSSSPKPPILRPGKVVAAPPTRPVQPMAYVEDDPHEFDYNVGGAYMLNDADEHILSRMVSGDFDRLHNGADYENEDYDEDE
jgi:hypothetical protein